MSKGSSGPGGGAEIAGFIVGGKFRSFTGGRGEKTNRDAVTSAFSADICRIFCKGVAMSENLPYNLQSFRSGKLFALPALFKNIQPISVGAWFWSSAAVRCLAGAQL